MGRNPHDFTQRQQTVSATLGRKHFLGGRFAAGRVQAGHFCDTASVFRIFRQMGGAQITAGEAFRAPKGGPRGIRNAIFPLNFQNFARPGSPRAPRGSAAPCTGTHIFAREFPFSAPPGAGRPAGTGPPRGGRKYPGRAFWALSAPGAGIASPRGIPAPGEGQGGPRGMPAGPGRGLRSRKALWPQTLLSENVFGGKS